jgi:hypothetical protein
MSLAPTRFHMAGSDFLPHPEFGLERVRRVFPGSGAKHCYSVFRRKPKVGT